MDAPLNSFDVDAYSARIGTPLSGAPDFNLLRTLQEAHLKAITFENIDVVLRRPIKLDLASIQNKLVNKRRGGYCYEQNALFAAALRSAGFHVQTLEARVRTTGALQPLARTHMTLRVDLDGRAWLVDVGFGCDGPLHPVPLDGEEQNQPGRAFRVTHEADDVHVLQASTGADWRDMYAFRLTPALPADYEMANYWTSTNPNSRFLHTMTAHLTTAQARHMLRGRTYTVFRGPDVETREVSDAEALELLRSVFGLDLGTDETSGL